MAAGRTAWEVAFQLTPILLTGGKLPSWAPGVPILAATEIVDLPLSAAISGLGGQPLLPAGTDDAFAQFQPMPGATVIDQQIATYPFANQEVAANATILMPNHVSYQMIAPARGSFGYFTKLAKMLALIEALKWHNRNGGTYLLISPSFVWSNCLMRNMRDASSGTTKQVQTTWMFDFERPLLTVEDALSAQQKLNNILDGLDSGTRVNGSPANQSLIQQAFNAPTGTLVTGSN